MNMVKHIKPVEVKKGKVSKANDKSDTADNNKDKYLRCLQKCDERISRNPKDEHAFIESGDAQIYLSNPESALNNYRRAITINPNSIKGYYGMATAHFMLGLNKNAVVEIIKAMELEQLLSVRALEIQQ
jgi:tetratricopeptide (TPR) repeat protein